jgi:hypothetical protein
VDRTRGSRGVVSSKSLQGRADYSDYVSRTVRLRAGLVARAERFALEANPINADYTDLLELFPTRTDSAFGAYLETDIDAGRVSIHPGIRTDLYQSQGNERIAVDPRLAARYRFSDAWRTVHAVGIAHQVPNYVPNVPGAAVAGLEGGLQQGVHTSSGVEHDLPDDFRASATVFNNAYFRLTDPIGASQSFSLDADTSRERFVGSARGLELSLSRPLTSRFGGLFNYTLSRTTRSRGAISTVAGFDRPHIVNLALVYDLGKNWRVGGRAVAYSGVPGSRVTTDGRVFDARRGRPFARVDLRLEKSYPFADDGRWIFTAEMLNSTFSSEVIRLRCNAEGCTESVVGPIPLPSLGVELHY